MEHHTDNIETISQWVKEASAGILTYDHEGARWGSLVRSDGQPIGFHTSFGETNPISGVVAQHIVVPSFKLNRIRRGWMADVADDVLAAAREMEHLGSVDDAFDIRIALRNWRSRWNLREA